MTKQLILNAESVEDANDWKVVVTCDVWSSHLVCWVGSDGGGAYLLVQPLVFGCVRAGVDVARSRYTRPTGITVRIILKMLSEENMLFVDIFFGPN